MPDLPLNVSIVDYGFGNLHSVKKAMHFINVNVSVIDKPRELEHADGVIIPGVGAFGDGMKGLQEHGFIGPLKAYAERNKPLLGICLGMQFLFSFSEEFGVHEGLDLIKGKVCHFPRKRIEDDFNYKIPHIGWNRLLKPCPANTWGHTLLDSIEEGGEVYFVHSYVAIPEDESTILAYSEYGGNFFAAAVKKENIYGCQFHPEKSRGTGIKILNNFVKIVSNFKDT